MTGTILHTDPVRAPGTEPDRWILFLAGIYGAGRNWGSVARRLVADRPDWGVVMVDLRGHGQSPTPPPPHDLHAVTDDLSATVRDLALPVRAMLGHSFGGKVSLLYALDHAPPLEQVWVVDSTPEARTPDGSAWGMLRVLREHPGPFPDRATAIAAVESAGYANAVAQWMSTNVVPGEDDTYRWRIDADVMEELLMDFFRTEAWDTLEHPPTGLDVHLIKATEGRVLEGEGLARVKEAAAARPDRVHLHEVEGGHWLNADNPDELHRLLVEWLPH
jgi:pimeloyl-ACP methyl ester carboxylesterase